MYLQLQKTDSEGSWHLLVCIYHQMQPRIWKAKPVLLNSVLWAICKPESLFQVVPTADGRKSARMIHKYYLQCILIKAKQEKENMFCFNKEMWQAKHEIWGKLYSCSNKTFNSDIQNNICINISWLCSPDHCSVWRKIYLNKDGGHATRI